MSDCLFCRIVAGEIGSFGVYEDADAVAFMDIAPVKPGHTLVVSRRHVPDALSDAAALAGLAPAITAVGGLLTRRLGADGMNILSNVGTVAGQSVFHLHVHLIPRFDSNPGIRTMLVPDAGIDVAEIHGRLVG